VDDSPRVQRVRHELKRRTLHVAHIEPWASQMVRVVLKGDDLRGFTSLGFDDHVKLFFPSAGDKPDVAGASSGESEMRDFTPRHFDAQAGELWIDFFLHEAGPAATWAAHARIGDTLEVGGPKGSAVISLDGIDGHVLVGDETAVPAIGRRLEELPVRARALAVIEIDKGSTWPRLVSRADIEVIWVCRDGRINPPGHELIDALGSLRFPAGRCFVWAAGESQSARAIRRYLREERGLEKRWIKAAGYWQRGSAGSHDKIADDECLRRWVQTRARED